MKIKKCLAVCKKCKHYNGEMDFSPEMTKDHKLLPMCAILKNDYTYTRDLYERMNEADRRIIFCAMFGEENYTRRQLHLMKMLIHSEKKIFTAMNKGMLKAIDIAKKDFRTDKDRRKLIPDKFCAFIPIKKCPYKMEHLVINQPLIN